MKKSKVMIASAIFLVLALLFTSAPFVSQIRAMELTTETPEMTEEPSEALPATDAAITDSSAETELMMEQSDEELPATDGAITEASAESELQGQPSEELPSTDTTLTIQVLDRVDDRAVERRLRTPPTLQVLK